MTRLRPGRWTCMMCPYRKSHERGTFANHLYDLLPRYDGTLEDQLEAGAVHPFMCALYETELCGGWVQCHDMTINLALRQHSSDVAWHEVLAYDYNAEVHPSGKAAAEAGRTPTGLARVLPLRRHRAAGTRTFRPPADQQSASHFRGCACTACQATKQPGSVINAKHADSCLCSTCKTAREDALVEKIVDSVLEWAVKGAAAPEATLDGELTRAAHILAVSPYLGELPGNGRWSPRHCEQPSCDCHSYRLNNSAGTSVPYTCHCGHNAAQHSTYSSVIRKETQEVLRK